MSDDPSPLSLLRDQQREFAERTEFRLNAHAATLKEHDDELAIVPVMKRAFYWVAIVLTGAIVAVIGAAATIILTAGGAK
jgi:hypothetical protein